MWWGKLIKKIKNSAIPCKYWWWGKDLNLQVSGFEPGAIISCDCPLLFLHSQTILHSTPKIRFKNSRIFLVKNTRNMRRCHCELMKGLSGVSFELKLLFTHCFLSQGHHRKLPKVSSDILF